MQCLAGKTLGLARRLVLPPKSVSLSVSASKGLEPTLLQSPVASRRSRVTAGFRENENSWSSVAMGRSDKTRLRVAVDVDEGEHASDASLMLSLMPSMQCLGVSCTR